MTLSRRTALYAAALSLVPRRLLAQGDDVADLIARVARARAPIHTLKGNFEQTRTVGLLATDVRSRGALTLVRPDRLRWELFPPDEVTFWVGPEGLAYRGKHGQGRLPRSASRFGDSLDDLRILLGDDLAKLRERWTLRATREDGVAGLEATPKAAAPARLQRIQFTLASDLARPRRVLLVEGPRDRTLIEFGELAANVAVDEATMRPPL